MAASLSNRIMSGNALNAFAVGWARWRTEAQAWLSAARSVVVAVHPGSVVNSGAGEVLMLAVSEAAVLADSYILGLGALFWDSSAITGALTGIGLVW